MRESFHKFGGPTDTFLKHEDVDSLIEDLTILYTKLVDLGMEYRNGQVHLADLEELEGKKDV